MLVKVLDIYFAALWISKYQIIIRYFYNLHCALNTSALQMYTLYIGVVQNDWKLVWCV